MILNRVQHEAGKAVASAVDGCLRGVRRRALDCVGPATKVREEHYVQQLAKDIPEAVNRNVARLFRQHGIDLRCSSVFVHQHPQVRAKEFPDKDREAVEIGDLLLVATHKTVARTDRWALLLQAKMMKGKKSDLRPGRKNKNQHHLYQYWPEFEYVRSGALSGQKRRVCGPNEYEGAQYLLIPKEGVFITPVWWKGDKDDEPGCVGLVQNNMRTAFPTDPLSSDALFSSGIYWMLFGNAGRPFVYRPIVHDGWNQVITDLLDETANWLFTFAGTPSHKRPRGFATCLYAGVPDFVTTDARASAYLRQHLGGSEDDGGNQDQLDMDREFPGGGISTIEFIIDEKPIEQWER